MNLRSPWPALLMVAAGICSGTGCIIISNLEGDQCQDDTECTARGPEFANTVCAPEGICVPAGALGCTTNKKCTEENGGEPYICPVVGGDCVGLLTEFCPRVVGDFEADNAIITTYFHPLSGPIAFIAQAAEPPQTMAVEEWKQVGGVKGREFVMVLCDEGSLEMAELGTKHVIEKLKVPATVGPNLSEYITLLAPKYHIPNNVLLYTIFAGAPSVEDLDDNGLVWSGWPSDRSQGRVMGLIGNELEARIREELSLAPNEPIRVAMETPSSANGYGETEAIEETLVFNGKKALDNGDNYKLFAHESTFQNPNVDIEGIAADIAAYEPHIVFYVGSPDFYAAVEPAWTATTHRPYHVLDGAGIEENALVAVGMDDDFRRRTLGVSPLHAQTAAYKGYLSRFKSRFNQDPVPLFEINYDAVYLLAYAAGAGSNAPALTGSVMAQGMAKLVPPGAVIDAGPVDVPKGLSALAAGGNIDFEGAFGKYNFDVSTGMAAHELALWCVKFDTEGAPQFSIKAEYGYWNPAEPEVLTGPVSCE